MDVNCALDRQAAHCRLTSMPDPHASRILIVEDEESLRNVLQTTLEQEGYSVATASDGGEALRHLRSSERPDLILLDLVMPGVDGMAFRREQRWDPERGEIPVIVVSAIAPEPDELRALAAADYLTKPFDMHRLLEVVARHCPPPARAAVRS